MKTWIRSKIEDSNTKLGFMFVVLIQALIVLSLVAFSIETLPNLPPSVLLALRWFETISIAIFTAECLTRIYIASRSCNYLFSFFGLIDLLAILPFYVGLGVDLRSMRAFRLLRIFRILKLARYSSAIRRFHIALRIAREELILFGCVTVILLFLAAVGIHFFEHEAQPETFASVFHCLWWAVSTLTTVGYGDVYPITVGGKIFTFFILLLGLGFISVPAGLVASALSKARQIQEHEHSEFEDTAI